jgi:hypothetical protein
MAEIVLGIGTSHSPMLNLTAQQWKHRAEVDHANQKLNLSDGRRLSYAALLQERGARWSAEVELPVMERKEKACQAALDRLGDALEQANPDVVIIVGDDQAELFSADNQPAFAIFLGAEIATMSGKYGAGATDWMRQVGRGYLMDELHRLPGSPELALKLIEGLMDLDIDVCSVAKVGDPARAGFGHAYGFVIKRLFRRPIPVVPVLLNTYFPPNVPSAGRCYDIGRKLRSVIEALPGSQRVAIVASGGLSHFVVDEAFDRGVLDAFANKDAEALRGISRNALKSGSSETLNWILTAGAVDFMELQMAEYFPLYRTEAGTGVGAAFCVWGGGRQRKQA